MIREIVEGIVNESSTLSKVGANSKQIKALYDKTSDRRWGGEVVKADAEWDLEKSKKAVTDTLRSSGVRHAAVAGVDKSGNLFVTIQWNDSYIDGSKMTFKTMKISPAGKVESTWNEKSAIKALSYFTGVKEYYISRKGSTKAKSSDQFYGAEGNVDYSDFSSKIANLVEKDLKTEFGKIKKRLANLIITAAKELDFAKVARYSDRMVQRGRWSGDPVEEVTFRNLYQDYDIGSIKTLIAKQVAKDTDKYIPNFGRIPAQERMMKLTDPKIQRKSAAVVLKDFKERLAMMAEVIEQEI